MQIKIISAGAGSGKTYRLTREMVDLLKGGLRASGILATTFTQKAAAELQERVRVRLLEEGLSRQADELTNAMIGTVHGLGVRLLKRFAYEAGVSPDVSIIADEDQQILFNQSLSTVLTEDRVLRMDYLCSRFGLNNDYFDWRREVRTLTEVARANDFSATVLERSKQLSMEHFLCFLGTDSGQGEEALRTGFQAMLESTIQVLEQNEDSTKLTQDAVKTLKTLRRELLLRGWLPWPEWARIGKLKVGAKSREDADALIRFAAACDSHPGFHQDVREFIGQIFDLALESIHEYDHYKKRRGLIDYTDMEVLVKRLLDQEQVRSVLAEEIDLLLVDEFQDTSPIQLEIFLKLSRLVRHSIWVGDPKQSIYGFRGADPRLMQAIITQAGGVRPEDILQDSWRSREDIVFATNALFTRAFSDLPAEQVALRPKRTKQAGSGTAAEPIGVDDALIHWHFKYDGEGRQPGKPWMENCLADSVRRLLDSKKYVLPKGEKDYRQARPGDIAILCRSNSECQQVAEALARAGLRVSISRAGLLQTAESKLVIACLKYLLHREDSLSVAEILLLAGGWSTEAIIEHRLGFLARAAETPPIRPWAAEESVIRKLDELRAVVAELSSSETLNLLLEELDLRRKIAAWGNLEQRLDNVDVLRRLSLRYEEACNRLHSAASLGGFLLWLNELHQKGEDMQGSGEGPDAVQVLTYHRSKGLEWPVVICHNLDDRLRADLWGIEIVAEREEVDLDNILGHRWLRYWVNPFDRQYRNTLLDERLQASPLQAQKTEQARREEARLLYVGLTRARDYLVFPTGGSPTKWLNRVWHGEEDVPTLIPETHESPWSWDGHHLDIKTDTFLFPKEFTYAEPAESAVRFPEARHGREPQIPYLIDLRREALQGDFSAHAGTVIQYGSPLVDGNEDNRVPLVRLVREFLTAFHPEDEDAALASLSREYLQRYQAEDLLDAGRLLQSGRQFYGFLHQHFDIRHWHRSYFIRYFYRNRLFETTLDLVLESSRGPVLIQHARFAGDTGKHKNEALRLADYLFLSRMALQEIFSSREVRTMVHFPLAGTLVEVALSRVAVL